MQPPSNIPESGVGQSLSLDTTVYSLEAIKRTAYKFADRASIVINRTSDASVTVVFRFIGANEKNNPQQVIADFCNELLDQDLRELVKKQTEPLRNVIIAHAFSRTTLAEKE
ncbi:MAG: His-Xaa-Ser system protein HxsD [Patescibacteria group bacterium]|nr:His-Xaa-Ser system protein HxsD [Patescibacteria group bacterium]